MIGCKHFSGYKNWVFGWLPLASWKTSGHTVPAPRVSLGLMEGRLLSSGGVGAKKRQGRADKGSLHTQLQRWESRGRRGSVEQQAGFCETCGVIRLTIRRRRGGSTEKAAAAAPRMIASVRTAVAIWDTRNNSRSTQRGTRGMVGVERGR